MSTTHPIFEKFVETLVQASRPPQADRVTVISTPLEAHPGCLAYQITGLTERDVQDEIDKIMVDVEVRGGFAEFRNPAKSREAAYFGKWQSRGWTRLRPVTEPAAPRSPPSGSFILLNTGCRRLAACRTSIRSAARRPRPRSGPKSGL